MYFQICLLTEPRVIVVSPSQSAARSSETLNSCVAKPPRAFLVLSAPALFTVARLRFLFPVDFFGFFFRALLFLLFELLLLFVRDGFDDPTRS